MRVIDMIDGWQLFLYLFLISGTALPATIFPVAYAVLVRWWKTAYGRFMMYMGVSFALILDLTAARIWLPPFPAWVSVAIYSLIFIMVWWCLILFIITWKRERNKKQKRSSEQRREDRQAEVKIRRTIMAQTEVKVSAATTGAFAASLALALLNATVADSAVLGGMPSWLQFILLAVAPTLVTYLAGYATPSKTSSVSTASRGRSVA